MSSHMFCIIKFFNDLKMPKCFRGENDSHGRDVTKNVNFKPVLLKNNVENAKERTPPES